jgi:hypothetical protein
VITPTVMSAYDFILRHLVHHHNRSQQLPNDFIGTLGNRKPPRGSGSKCSGLGSHA